jgi:hypothetical protein
MGTFFGDAREIGVGYYFRAAATYDHYWTIHATRSNDLGPFVTGVVYDDVNGNSRYDLNEGLANITVRVGSLVTTTNAAGGWSVKAPNGEYTVTASGTGFTGTSYAPIVVNNQNIEVDFASGQSTGWVNFTRWVNRDQ